MTLDMNDEYLVTIEQLERFVQSSVGIVFSGAKRKEKYSWIDKILTRFMYRTLSKKNKMTVRAYLIHITGYSRSQLTRLVEKKRKTKTVSVRVAQTHHSFATKYTKEDIALLIETDNLHGRLSGPATKKLFERQYDVFHDERFIRLKNISVAHLYNLRGTNQYRSHAMTFTKTQSIQVPIGERRAPETQGKPGYIRVDSVHQGDLEGMKGVYHINLVDTVLQWELVGCVETICDRDLVPLLESLIQQFPFRILGFHSDNGSEYINRQVAAMLNRLLIKQTKSRPRHSNDNALAESKNGSVIRKHMGYIHIPKRYAKNINLFFESHLNIYVNYHRPSGYATITIDKKGKQKKKYDTYMTPYERLKSLPDADSYLRDGITFDTLDDISAGMTDNECAKAMQEAKTTLFLPFRKTG